MTARHFTSLAFVAFVLCGASTETWAQSRYEQKAAAQIVRFAQAAPNFANLAGRWVRPDGGYVIDIKSVDSSGKMEATYANPKPIRVSKANASIEGAGLKISIELQGAGYPGSTYTLTYVPSSDHLIGVYFQAAAQQKFDVVFIRQK